MRVLFRRDQSGIARPVLSDGRVVIGSAACLAGHVCGCNVEQPGACCIAGVCSSRTFADCLAAGGNFLGGPCTPGVCLVAPCCADPDQACYITGGESPYTVFRTMTVRVVNTRQDGSSFSAYGTKTFTDVFTATTPICPSFFGIDVNATLDCEICVDPATGTTCFCSNVPNRPFGIAFLHTKNVGDPLAPPAPYLEVRGAGNPSAVVYRPATCAGGRWSVSLPPYLMPNGDTISQYDIDVEFRIERAARCDGIPETGACCYPDLSCLQLPASYESQCINSGGRWLGLGSSCNPNPCIGENGSCCLPDGRCIEGVTEDRCRVLANYDPSYQFNLGGSCADCFGACCLPGGGCVNTSRSRCINRGGTFRRVFPAVPNPCGIPDLCGPPDPLCCSGPAPCNTCYIPDGITVPSTLSVTLSADFWTTPTGGSCTFQESLIINQQGGDAALIGGCTFETSTASTQLTRPGAPNLTASVQYKSCGENGRGPHLIVSSTAGGAGGRTTLHDVVCSGGSVLTTRIPFGQPCGASFQWRNIQIQASASIPLARACGGLAARPSRIIVPSGGTVSAVTSGCSGCGKGLGERAF